MVSAQFPRTRSPNMDNFTTRMIAPNPDLTSAPASTKLEARDLDVYYGKFHAIKNANLSVFDHCVMALIGPSGCGKSTFIRALNRMHDLTPDARVDGKVLLDGEDIYAQQHRSSHRSATGSGWSFSVPTRFPRRSSRTSSTDRKIHGERNRKTLDGNLRAKPAARRALGRGQRSPRPFRAWISRAASSSAFASRAVLPSIPK